MRKYALSLLATVSVFGIGIANAQEETGVQKVGGLETITVTARKRAESLQDVPVAVAAIPKVALQNNLANDLSKN